MPHIHAQIDFVVSCFIARKGKVLLVDHKKLGCWLPVGGHVELGQDTDQALDAEVAEETGIPVEFIEPPTTLPPFPADLKVSQRQKTKRLRTPWAVEIHDFPGFEGHRHLALVYFARGLSDDIRLNRGEHNDIRWFSPLDLQEFLWINPLDPDDFGNPPRIPDTIRWYALNAINTEAWTWTGPVEEPGS